MTGMCAGSCFASELNATVSFSDIRQASGRAAAKECSTALRWVYRSKNYMFTR
jgi:hypothetical protein